MTHQNITQAFSPTLINLLDEVKHCQLCERHLPLGPNPVVQISHTARLLIIGQAPGTRVHHSGIPWDDPSGDRLRRWLNLDKTVFYDATRVAIMPMGFCYPGKGRSGDLPPRTECAPQWHQQLLSHMPNLELTLLIGQYAQNYYFDRPRQSLTQRVQQWRSYQQPNQTLQYLPLPHPSPRNIRWFNNNPWFEEELIPHLQQQLTSLWS